ncbi:MAG: type II toxin-antitoxin system PemK/MazF family toxin [Deltaproteobacteria bacterium]|nr:type II toxin-antitoxin system PemK/MazF family toxin [Deltaproteobacteria bacterium]
MSLAYPNFPLRRGDIYKIKVKYTEDPTEGKERPVLVLRDERFDKITSSHTTVASGTSNSKYANYPLALKVDPKKIEGLKLDKPTFFLANLLYTIDKQKYFAGQPFIGRLSESLMKQFDVLLVLALQIDLYK